MSFRHYTKLKEIADRVGCDSSDCTTNGALLDRIYESPVAATPVKLGGADNAPTINFPECVLRVIRPVKGHNYAGWVGDIVQTYLDRYPDTPEDDLYLLQLEGVKGTWNLEGSTKKVEKPFGSRQYIIDGDGSTMSELILNDVDDVDLFCFAAVDKTVGVAPFRGATIETIKSNVQTAPITLTLTNYALTFVIKEIVG